MGGRQFTCSFSVPPSHPYLSFEDSSRGCICSPYLYWPILSFGRVASLGGQVWVVGTYFPGPPSFTLCSLMPKAFSRALGVSFPPFQVLLPDACLPVAARPGEGFMLI